MNKGIPKITFSECNQEVIKTFARFVLSKKCKKHGSQCFCPKTCMSYENGQIPNYKCTYVRASYVCKYFYSHKAELVRILKETNFTKKELCALSFGAGPGIDMISIMEWLHDSKKAGDNIPNKLIFTRVDKERDWKTEADTISTIYQTCFNNMGTKVEKFLIPSDVLKFDGTSPKYNLAIFSYILSEVLDSFSDKHAKALWQALRRSMVPDKHVLILNDRAQAKVTEAFDLLTKHIKATNPNSIIKDYSFNENYAASSSSIKWNSRWCGEIYPDEYKDTFEPVLNCNSIQRLICVQ